MAEPRSGLGKQMTTPNILNIFIFIFKETKLFLVFVLNYITATVLLYLSAGGDLHISPLNSPITSKADPALRTCTAH